MRLGRKVMGDTEVMPAQSKIRSAPEFIQDRFENSDE
jgi:hypothetical protein